ncbi:MAG: hypothetical protein EPN82_13040 [Bacteroidetes bacterium]|nr:MAG: hypothetical protein EPN82_13040 [Bacteroidota bacterium]
MRRNNGNMKDERYCGNTHKMEVNDLDNEKTSCQIDEIINAGHDKPFHSLLIAQIQGYDKCNWCIGDSKR